MSSPHLRECNSTALLHASLPLKGFNLPQQPADRALAGVAASGELLPAFPVALPPGLAPFGAVSILCRAPLPAAPLALMGRSLWPESGLSACSSSSEAGLSGVCTSLDTPAGDEQL